MTQLRRQPDPSAEQPSTKRGRARWTSLCRVMANDLSGMPRNYQRKMETKYTLENLEKAIENVRNNVLTLGKAASAYSVPKSTLHDHLKKEVIQQPKCGKKAIFSEQQEKQLEKHIIKCSKVFCRRITQYDVVELFTKAYNRISNIEKAASGFQAAVILPLNPNKFDDQLVDVTSSPQLPSSNRNSQIEVTQEAQITSPSNFPRLETSSATLDNSIPLREVATVPNLPQPQTKQKEKEQKKQVKEQNPEQTESKTETKNKNKKGIKNLTKIAGCNEAVKKVPRKKKKVPEESGKENEYYCLICGEKYEDPPTEDWIKCYKCSSWAHEKCIQVVKVHQGVTSVIFVNNNPHPQLPHTPSAITPHALGNPGHQGVFVLVKS
ncbi:hypothetical protein ILUMI_03688 [Ignelater luminosus]|uniref:HTH psq-type domain-containing protein n=1 Tax=Ignelater luminosus TaxID=2038154 RepID=A0A8K0DAI6_IGNLU|nr:hypothetical protein ILUMI_03688 [Ignelater luminosus]